MQVTLLFYLSPPDPPLVGSEGFEKASGGGVRRKARRVQIDGAIKKTWARGRGVRKKAGQKRSTVQANGSPN